MRIGFDVSQTGSRKAGCGYFAASLVSALARSGGDHDYVLYPAFGDLYFEKNQGSCVRPRGGRVRIGPRFRRFSDQKRFFQHPPRDFEKRLGNPYIVQANNFFCPTGLSRSRLVYTLYDLSFLENPDWSKEDNRVGCFEGVFRAAMLADGLVAISEFSRAHFLRIFPHYPPERTFVAHLASRFDPGGPQKRPKAAEGLEPGRFWLSVGTVEPRKNHAGLFRAYAEWKRASGGGLPLVLAGGQGWLVDDLAGLVAELGIGRDIVFTGYLADEELAWLYAGCRGFLYPSHFEGFGLPVLEAMGLGAPVIASDRTSITEIAAGAALLVDPSDPRGLARAMERLAGDEAMCGELSDKARRRAGMFSWDKTAGAVLGAYQAVASLPRFALDAGRG